MNLGDEFVRAFARGLGYRAARSLSPASFAWAVIFLLVLFMLGKCVG